MTPEQVEQFEQWLAERIYSSSAGYLAALEETLRAFSLITGRDTWNRYLEQQNNLEDKQ